MNLDDVQSHTTYAVIHTAHARMYACIHALHCAVLVHVDKLTIIMILVAITFVTMVNSEHNLNNFEVD